MMTFYRFFVLSRPTMTLFCIEISSFLIAAQKLCRFGDKWAQQSWAIAGLCFRFSHLFQGERFLGKRVLATLSNSLYICWPHSHC